MLAGPETGHVGMSTRTCGHSVAERITPLLPRTPATTPNGQCRGGRVVGIANSIVPGALWRARSRVSLIDEIRILSETESRFVWVVEWVRERRRLKMSDERIWCDFALVPREGVYGDRSTDDG